MDKLLKRTLNEKIRTQRYPSRSYYSLLAEAEGFAPQTTFAITPVSQTAVSSAVWSACFCCCIWHRLQADCRAVRIPHKQKRETQTTSVRISLFWRRLRDSNPRGFCPNGFQDRLVMTASISLRLFGFFLRFFASLQCLCFRIFCGEKVVVVCCRATFTFARLSNYILFFRKNQLFFSENYCFPNFSVFRLFLSLVCVRI